MWVKVEERERSVEGRGSVDESGRGRGEVGVLYSRVVCVLFACWMRESPLCGLW